MAPRSTPSCALSRHLEDIPEERPPLLLLTPLSDPICQAPCYTHPRRVLSPPSDVAHREPRANRVGHPRATLRISDTRIQPTLPVPPPLGLASSGGLLSLPPVAFPLGTNHKPSSLCSSTVIKCWTFTSCPVSSWECGDEEECPSIHCCDPPSASTSQSLPKANTDGNPGPHLDCPSRSYCSQAASRLRLQVCLCRGLWGDKDT